jgi:tRNA(His) guanylyltransferase
MSDKKDNLGNRVKGYENCSRYYLQRRTPVILRIDGQHFSSFTKNCKKPFDGALNNAMVTSAMMTAENMQGFKLAYHQSDEVTFFLSDWETFETCAWFDNNLAKLQTITASMFTAYFNDNYPKYKEDQHSSYWIDNPPLKYEDMPDFKYEDGLAFFDCRAFNVPKEEVANMFLWRQKDWHRNSIQMLGRSQFSQKQLHGKNMEQIKALLLEKGQDWENLPDEYKNGTFIVNNNGKIEVFRNIKSNYADIAALVDPFLSSNKS